MNSGLLGPLLNLILSHFLFFPSYNPIHYTSISILPTFECKASYCNTCLSGQTRSGVQVTVKKLTRRKAHGSLGHDISLQLPLCTCWTFSSLSRLQLHVFEQLDLFYTVQFRLPFRRFRVVFAVSLCWSVGIVHNVSWVPCLHEPSYKSEQCTWRESTVSKSRVTT